MMWDQDSLTDDSEAVAAAFVAARRAATTLDAYPGRRPDDLAAAYRIQDHAIVLDGRAVAGWKVGRIFPPEDARLGNNRLAGPIFADSVVDSATGAATMPVIPGGFAAAEAEFVLRIAAGWDGTVPDDDAATLALIDKVHIGIEIASSPYAAINADGPTVTASDFGNNYGLLLGPELDGWRSCDLRAVFVRTTIDGNLAGEATAATMLDGPLGAVRFLLGNVAGRSIDVSGGTWVSTGAVTGVHQVRPGQVVEARFGGQSVGCRIIAATPG